MQWGAVKPHIYKEKSESTDAVFKISQKLHFFTAKCSLYQQQCIFKRK